MTPRNFGRLVAQYMQKSAAPPGQPQIGKPAGGQTLSLNSPQQNLAPSTVVSGGTMGASQPPRQPMAPPKPTAGISPPNGSFFQEWMNPPKPARSSGAPTNSPFINTLDRWYNPWTKQTGREKGEQGLMRAGQVALGTGAAAGAAAGALTAAPAVAGMMTGGGGTTAATAGTGAAAATQTPAGQNFIQRAGQMANTAGQTAGNLAMQYQTRVAPTLERFNYKPEDVAMDAYSAATGHFDNIKGPGWAFKGPSMPIGAPSLPKPLQVWKDVYGAGAGMLPGANTARAGAGAKLSRM